MRWGRVRTCACWPTLIILVVLACNKTKSDQMPGASSSSQQSSGDDEYCQEKWNRFTVTIRGDTQRLAMPPRGFAITGLRANIPEFNDCQRMIVNNGTIFGSTIAIFAAENLRDILDPSAPPPTPPKIAVAAALILNRDSQFAQDELVIEPAFSCLYLWKVGSGNGPPHAKIRSVGTAQEECAQAMDPGEINAKELKVLPRGRDGYTSPTDYPDVARWDWDDRQKLQYIAIKCGVGWCDIGDRQFTSSPDRNDNGNVGQKRVAHIKPWHDEQYLALPDPAGGKARLSSLLGSIFPHPELESRAIGDYYNRWLPVAYVAIDGGTASEKQEILTEYFYDAIPYAGYLDRLNVISMCHGMRADCKIPTPGTDPNTPSVTCPNETGPVTANDHWWMRTQARTRPGKIMYRCVIRMDHSAVAGTVHFAGTARWRWLRNDETAWILCDQGCCQKDAAIKPF